MGSTLREAWLNLNLTTVHSLTSRASPSNITARNESGLADVSSLGDFVVCPVTLDLLGSRRINPMGQAQPF